MTTEAADEDRRWMDAALTLAARGLGAVWPNPAVGCVLVRDGAAVGRGWTQPGGRPHAETGALGRAGAAAKGATAYVSLEPCAHRGCTPPCAEALIEAGVARCVFALRDPDPRVAGKGAARLRAAGVATLEGVRGEEAAELNRGFLLRVGAGRPLVTWKVASTLDGRIAACGGDSKWITGETARARAHLLRARHDAVLVGARTAHVDRPRLTCRLPGMEDRSPLRVLVAGRAPPPAGLFGGDSGPVWIVHRDDAAPPELAGAEAIPVAPDGDAVSMPAALAALAARGVTRVLVEGGGRIAASLLRAGLVDRIEWFRAPALIGGDGVAAAAPFGIDAVARAPRFRRAACLRLGNDTLESYSAVP